VINAPFGSTIFATSADEDVVPARPELYEYVKVPAGDVYIQLSGLDPFMPVNECEYK
jgi:hypothetical protein